MNRLRQRLFAHVSPDDGLTLIEVMVALVVFATISVGVLYAMTSLLSVTRDSRNRQVAANLAAQEIDLARDVNDVFNVEPYTHVVDLEPNNPNNDLFTVARTADWVYSTGGAAECGSGAGTLRYKYVEVNVTWEGMRTEGGVSSETFINPNERLNDPAKGTIIVSVHTSGGEPVPNVPVTATPTPGTVRTDTTDSQGCAFMLGVVPGNYTVKITSPTGKSYVDTTGAQEPTQPATVVAGTSVSPAFTFDPSGTLRVTYNTAGMLVPLNLPTSLLSTRDTVVTTATAAANPRSFLVSPWPDGYSVIAGDAKTCAAADPELWTASGGKEDGVRPDPVAAADGQTTDVTAPTSTLTVTGMATTGSGNRYLVAVSHSSPGNGQPDCATQQTYRFAQTSVATMVVSLPYGSWDIYKGTTSTFVATSGTKITSGMTAGVGGSISSGVVTLDPR
jgi:prepilin-type N-terminal cleavage/methylation domain-containing protein